MTSYARHMKAYFDSKDVLCEVIVLKAKKKIGRPKTSGDMVVTEFTFDQSEELVERLNRDFDLVQIHSVPPKNIGEGIAEAYVERIIEPITTRKVFINHDHASASFSRNADYIRAIEACDKTLVHSLEPARRGFVSWAEKRDVKANLDKLDIFFHVPMVEELINYSKKDRFKRVICAGRAASWKRTELTFRLFPLIKEYGFITEVIGFERSLAAFETLNAYEAVYPFWHGKKEECGIETKSASASSDPIFNDSLFEWFDRTGQSTEMIYSTGAFVHRTGMKRISQSAYAVHGRTFESNGLDYGNNPEFQTLECMLFAVPVVHRHFLSTAVLPGTNTNLIDTGAFLTIDDDGVRGPDKMGPQLVGGPELAQQMEDIWNDGYEEARRASVSLVKEYYSTEKLIPIMMERCM